MAERWRRSPIPRTPEEERSYSVARHEERSYRVAGETALGRADWGEHESDYAHGYAAFPSYPPSHGRPPVDYGGRHRRAVPVSHQRPGEMAPREPLSHWPEYMGRGPRGYRRSDERILEDICERLTADPRIDATDIDVTTNEGAVRLSGWVRSADERWWAEEVAEAVTGVRDLENEIRIHGSHR